MNDQNELSRIYKNIGGFLSSIYANVKGFVSDDTDGASKTELLVVKTLQWIVQITAGILTYYAPIHMLTRPFVEIFPENGATMVKVISAVFVIIMEFSAYSFIKRMAENFTKSAVSKERGNFLIWGLFYLLLSGAICYGSWKAAQVGAEDMVKAKTDKSSQIIDKKEGNLAILQSQYKDSKRSINDMHNKSISGAEKVLSDYQKKATWENPTTLNNMVASIANAKKEKNEALQKLKDEYETDIKKEEGSTIKPMEDNKSTQSLYQRGIFYFSILLELVKIITIFILKAAPYMRPKGAKSSHSFSTNEISEEKKTSIHTQVPIEIIEEKKNDLPTITEEVPEVISDEKSPLVEYTQAIDNRRKLKNDFKEHFNNGKLPYNKLVERWIKNETRIEVACKVLGQPYTAVSIPTNPKLLKIP